MSSTEPIIQIRGLKKSFGTRDVLGGIDLDIMAGESVVIIGTSGAGKSVLLKCLLGLLEADAGSIRIGGLEMVGSNARTRQEILSTAGMLFQGAALFDSITIADNIAFPLHNAPRPQRLPTNEITHTVHQCLRQVGLSDRRLGEFPENISIGMQKRVGLARAIAAKPSILFFDEPTTGLDPIAGKVINDLIRTVTTQTAATAITITHDMDSATHIGDTIAMLWGGQLIHKGPAARIMEEKHPIVHQFVHGLSANSPAPQPDQIGHSV